ncbi:hypothetical protein SAMN05444398_103267 [Roseovarius pacificus]|uniref:Uncharacterized protein n=1 Tax=Roseovarius pacificus TaxID=337701 RepID=A0A1M7BIZ6_9RHOB|nr:hypothetical protein [Roseovarius pacificus]GGO55183.1 hypothetical protein GCM10011315_17120 [Roseovarius pacificus]SHL55028.1 hypothetical protein SAMN05444398_103267 [Roseovarius pacificus]
MRERKIKMTRQQMQDEAGIIQTLLSAALYMHSEPNREDLFVIIEKAQDRAYRLNIALDDVNAPEGMA